MSDTFYHSILLTNYIFYSHFFHRKFPILTNRTNNNLFLCVSIDNEHYVWLLSTKMSVIFIVLKIVVGSFFLWNNLWRAVRNKIIYLLLWKFYGKMCSGFFNIKYVFLLRWESFWDLSWNIFSMSKFSSTLWVQTIVVA
jgi:hypothetical protein